VTRNDNDNNNNNISYLSGPWILDNSSLKETGPRLMEHGSSISNEIDSKSEKSPARKCSRDFREEKTAFNEEWKNK
jgi:hypothetical protein